MSVQLNLETLREGFKYDVKIRNLTAEDSIFFPVEAYYTLEQFLLSSIWFDTVRIIIDDPIDRVETVVISKSLSDSFLRVQLLMQ